MAFQPGVRKFPAQRSLRRDVADQPITCGIVTGGNFHCRPLRAGLERFDSEHPVDHGHTVLVHAADRRADLRVGVPTDGFFEKIQQTRLALEHGQQTQRIMARRGGRGRRNRSRKRHGCGRRRGGFRRLTGQEPANLRGKGIITADAPQRLDPEGEILDEREANGEYNGDDAERQKNGGEVSHVTECLMSDARAVKFMDVQEQWTAVDRYLTDRLVPADPILDAALAASEAGGLPAIQVAPNQGKMLALFARMIGAKRILEIGTLGGYSTLWLARGLPADGSGRIVTLEFEELHAEVARANFARAGLSAVVEVRVGPALETLPVLAAEGGPAFDLIFIDADKENYPGYLEWSLKLARPGALIVADNIVRQGHVADPACDDARVRGAQGFLEMLAAAEHEGRLTATAVQTVGSKGYDGFALAIVAG